MIGDADSATSNWACRQVVVQIPVRQTDAEHCPAKC